MSNDRELFAQALREAFVRKFEAELAEPVIDVQTGTELTPGDLENCLGGDNHPENPLCCDGCDYPEACYPEQPSELNGEPRPSRIVSMPSKQSF